ncbi:MAG TPA: glycine betaine ABC transporter substrate-binding protein [Burkholderiales bacterium]|nr:glycine betaine ABC transporter substrate-binding protein [Burkholderiales bacterium]
MAAPPAPAADAVLHVGSKRFTESYILGEILTQAAAPHARVEHKQGLGNTAIVYEALRSGSIDLYAEYSGTIALEILKRGGPVSIAELDSALAGEGLGVAIPLGFNDSYALAMRSADAARLDLRTLGDLARHPELRLGLSHEFLGRVDGWPGLAQAYHLPQQPTSLDHGLAYQALGKQQVDVIDIYSTDAQIAKQGLAVLADDRNYFPRYDAVVLYRRDLPQRFPQAWAALQKLEGRINVQQMIAMNAAAELEGRSFTVIAQDFLRTGQVPAQSSSGKTRRDSLWDKLFDDHLWTLTRQHVFLVLVSLAAGCLIGLPLGVLAARAPHLRQPVLTIVGVLQTIPSLALLAMLIPLLGAIGTLPALAALFVYSLLPIVRNTMTGLQGVPAGLSQAAVALGLRPRQRLLYVELPLAAPVILAGVKTAAVTSVGTATIAAFIGAGGYGERIATGLALNDNNLLLAGAIPAALLAVATQWAFDLAEYALQRRRRSAAR